MVNRQVSTRFWHDGDCFFLESVTSIDFNERPVRDALRGRLNEGAGRMSSALIAIVTAMAAIGPVKEPSAPCNESIRQQDLRADLFFLAGDAFQGRLTGTPGNKLAAEFIASRFERLGLKTIGSDGSYFQPFLLSTATLGPANKLRGAGYPRVQPGERLHSAALFLHRRMVSSSHIRRLRHQRREARARRLSRSECPKHDRPRPGARTG